MKKIFLLCFLAHFGAVQGQKLTPNLEVLRLGGDDLEYDRKITYEGLQTFLKYELKLKVPSSLLSHLHSTFVQKLEREPSKLFPSVSRRM